MNEDIELHIDPELENLIPGGITEEEFSQLEANILETGEVFESIKVWNGTIVDGHNRWKIIQKYPEIPFTVKEMDFADKSEAISWICRNQMGRRNLNPNQKAAVMAIAYNAESSHYFHGNQYTSENKDLVNCQNDSLPKNAAKEIAKRFGVSERTVYRNVGVMNGVNAADEVLPGFKNKFMAGEIKARRETFAGIAEVPEEHREEVAKAVEKIGEGDDGLNAEELISRYTHGKFFPGLFKEDGSEVKNLRSTLENTISSLNERIEITDFEDEILFEKETNKIIEDLISELFDITADLRKRISKVHEITDSAEAE